MGIELLIILTTMSNKKKRFILPEEEIPQYWYNIQADMVNKPMPPLHPGTKQPLKAEDLYPIFAEELCRQELNQTDTWIEIPEEVREMYKYYRSTPLVRAYGLEKALGTPAHIYFKNESVSPMGSHKLNSAIPQAYYCKQEGVTNVTTETGAGQWGASLAYAARLFGLEAAVYQVKISYVKLKPQPLPVCHNRPQVSGEIPIGEIRKATGMRGEHCRGDNSRFDSRRGQNRQGHC